jgi:hypothetical protein
MSNIFFKQFLEHFKRYSAEISANWQHRKEFFPLVIEVVEACVLVCRILSHKTHPEDPQVPSSPRSAQGKWTGIPPKGEFTPPILAPDFLLCKGTTTKDVKHRFRDTLVSMRISIQDLFSDQGS